MRLRTGDMRNTVLGLVSHVTSGARTVPIVFPCFHTCLLEFGLFLLVVSLKFQYYPEAPTMVGEPRYQLPTSRCLAAHSVPQPCLSWVLVDAECTACTKLIDVLRIVEKTVS